MRLIDADALMKHAELKEWGLTKNLWINAEVFRNAPTVDAAPVRHGHWQRLNFLMVACSECRNLFVEEYAYCPHCGAKMDESTMGQVKPNEGERKEDEVD